MMMMTGEETLLRAVEWRSTNENNSLSIKNNQETYNIEETITNIGSLS